MTTTLGTRPADPGAASVRTFIGRPPCSQPIWSMLHLTGCVRHGRAERGPTLPPYEFDAPMDDQPIPPQPPTTPPATEPVRVRPTSGTSRRFGRLAGIGLVLSLALVATFGVGVGVGRLATPVDGAAVPATASPAAAAGPASPAGPTDFSLIQEAWATLHKEYVRKDTLDDKALIYGAINGMTEAVGDTGHTDFMTPQERAARNAALSGSYVGIGVRIDTTDGGLPRIVSVFRDSPASRAGVKPDDLLVDVDGKSAQDKTLDEVAGWVRGEAGTTVSITLRAGVDGPERSLSIVRADVPLEPVSWALVPGTTTALVRLDQFSSGAADELVKALKAAREMGAQRVVLDLRGNPGGYVNEAVGVASQFLDKGVVYIERNAQGGEERHDVSTGGVATDLPLVVLVDVNTASSSEIVSGALQDAKRAKIVGETTFGTGTVLSEFSLTDGSALRVGTVEWLTPDGRRIWKEGIAPDVPVKLAEGVLPVVPDDVRGMTPAEVSAIKDAQLTRALEVVATETLAAGS